jgi:hypothetical protein
MGMLGMTEGGRIYETASHRPDGKGFERMPVDVDVKDVTLDNAVANANSELEISNKELSHHNLKENIQAELEANSWRTLKARADKIQAVKDELSKNPEYQKQLQYDGLLQNISRSSDFNNLEISGYGLSSDGTHGPSRAQRAYEAALLQQMGHIGAAEGSVISEDIFSVDASEKEQIELQYYADQLKKQNELNAFNAQGTRYQVKAPVVPASLPATYANLDSGTSREEDVVAIPSLLKNPLVLIVGGIIIGRLFLK